MKIQSVRIENFRCFKDETISFEDYNCFVGPNGSGKSTVFNALNVFFRQNKDSKTDLLKLTEDDFHHKITDDPIKITVTFNDLSVQAKKDLSDYVRQDKLIVSAVAKYDSDLGVAEVKQYGNRLGLGGFRIFFEAEKEGQKVAELKSIYSKLQFKYPDLPKASTKPEMIKNLHKYENDHSEQCKLIPSEDQFYGISKGVNRLAPHIQWIFISAVKDVTEESEESKRSTLGQLLERTVRSRINFSEKIGNLKRTVQSEYQNILDSEQSVLEDLSTSLQNRLREWAHPAINAQVLWKQDAEKSVKLEEPWAFVRIGERNFESELCRFGHGLQRSFLLAVLQELTIVEDEKAPTLVMAIEEPELYQHPPQARHLAETLQDLSEKGSQISLCSHYPLFIPGDNFDKVYVVRERGNPSYSYVSKLNYDELSERLHDAGQKLLRETGMMAKLYPSLNPIINEMFFCKSLILVEGVEDLAYLTTYLILTGEILHFRKNGCHIVPVGGKSHIIKPLAMSCLLNIPTYVMCDADTNKTKEDEIIRHKKDNKSILILTGYPKQNNWPESDIIEKNLTMWKNSLSDYINNELGEDWTKYRSESNEYYGNPGGLQKNPLTIARALETAWKNGLISKTLAEIVRIIANPN